MFCANLENPEQHAKMLLLDADCNNMKSQI